MYVSGDAKTLLLLPTTFESKLVIQPLHYRLEMRSTRRLDGIDELRRRETGRDGRSRGETTLLLHNATEGARIALLIGI